VVFLKGLALHSLLPIGTFHTKRNFFVHDIVDVATVVNYCLNSAVRSEKLIFCLLHGLIPLKTLRLIVYLSWNLILIFYR